jgi:hypothetical protein
VAKPTVKELLASSSLAFTGSVESVGTSPVAGLDVDDRTVVVRVDELLREPPRMRIPVGSRVVVQLSPKLPKLAAGDSATFFANGLIYGENVAVSEVGRAPLAATSGPASLVAGFAAPVSPVEAAMAELRQDEVAEHAAAADAVIRGHVVGLAHVPKEGPPGEHDADWWIAPLEVDLLARGKLAAGAEVGGTVSVLYANSLDVSWRDRPKPKAGQAGLWLLHKTSGELRTLAPFQLIHPIDLQPSIQLDLLRERGLAAGTGDEGDDA